MTGYVGNIEKQTLKNNYFRQILFTAKNAQLVVMCLQRGEEIGDEVHHDVDPFFRIEQGTVHKTKADAAKAEEEHH
jgi:mannose-6-phosphate isomerase-like protein (cupin superfamily)